MRLKIFKNKMINISRLNSAIEILNIKIMSLLYQVAAIIRIMNMNIKVFKIN